MKKILLSLTVVLLVLVLVGCTKDKPNPEPTINNSYYKEADAMLKKTYDFFWTEGANRFSAFNPEDTTPGSTYRGTTALWGYGAMMTAVGAGLKANPDGRLLREKADEMVKELEQYRYPSKTLYYSAGIGGGEAYYDDNAWVVLALYEYGIYLENQAYIDLSRELLKYVLSGESEDGGIYWKETVISRNTCSTAPAILGALLHYQLTGEEELLETAIRLYNWTYNTLRDPADSIYWDNAVFENGVEKIEKTKWTYNTGTMIWAGLLLNEITEEQKYLDHASESVTNSISRFYQVDNQRDTAYFPATPWFNVYLFRGYSEFARVTGDTKGMDALINAFDKALVHGLDDDGFIYPSWGSGQILSKYEYRDLLDIAGTLEAAYLIADYQLNIAK